MARIKSVLIKAALAGMVVAIVGCDNSPDGVWVKDKEKEERLYSQCLESVKVSVRAGEDNLEHALDQCRRNASIISSEYEALPRGENTR